MIGQDVWQRVFTARSATVAQWGGVIAGVHCLLYGLAGALIWTAARALLPDLSNPDHAFAAVANEVLPAEILGLVLAAALAAIMPTASAGLLAFSTILANDVYGGFIVRNRSDEYEASHISTLVVGVVVLAISVAGRRGARVHAGEQRRGHRVHDFARTTDQLSHLRRDADEPDRRLGEHAHAAGFGPRCGSLGGASGQTRGWRQRVEFRRGETRITSILERLKTTGSR